MIETIKEEEEAKMKAMKTAFETTREETKNQDVEELESMKHELIKQIDALDQNFEVSFNRYANDTDNKVKEYKDLLHKNESNSKKIKILHH